MEWSRRARETIAKVHASLPEDISFTARTKAIRAAYPFGERRYFPYKAWLKAQRNYLRRFDPKVHHPTTREQITAGRDDLYFPYAKDQPA